MELVGMRAALLEVQTDGSTVGSVLCRIVQQMEQDMGDILLVDHRAHLLGIHRQVDIALYLVANLIHQCLAERLDLCLLQFYGLIGAVFQIR